MCVHIRKSMLAHNTFFFTDAFDTRKNPPEANVRFAIIDPFLKAILTCTGCKVNLEDELCHKESKISGKADYAVYHVKLSGKVRVLILEAKRDRIVTDHSVCQTVGYYMASDSNSLLPPLGILMTQSKIKFIFFPFGDHSNSLRYVDAFVSCEIKLFENDKSFHYIVAFIVKYILAETQSYWSVTNLIKDTSTSISLHKKKIYSFIPDRELEARMEIETLKKKLKEAEEREKILATKTGMCPAYQFCSIIK